MGDIVDLPPPSAARVRLKGRGGRTSGTRAKGNPDNHGAGWGGPAKGAGNGSPAAGPESLIPGQPPAKVLNSQEKKALREARVAILEDTLFERATQSVDLNASISAAAKLHAIYEGQPIARQITAQVDDIARLNDDELRSELARLGGTGTGDQAGTPPKGLPN